MQYPTIKESVEKAPKICAKNYKPLYKVQKKHEKICTQIIKQVVKEPKLGENKLDSFK